MKRSSIIGKAVFAGTLAILIPTSFMGYLGWLLALNGAHQRLESIAQLVSQRTHSTLEQASGALKTVAATQLQPCSPEGIDEMRLVSVNTFSVKSVGYVEEDIFVCGSWGLMGRQVEPWAEDYTTAEGVKVSVGASPWLESAKPMLALQYAAFNVLVDAEQFLEVVLDSRIALAVGTRSGQVVQASSQNVGGILAFAHAGPLSGMSEGFLYSMVQHENWVVVAAISRPELWGILVEHQLFVLPVGLIVSGLLMFFVLRGAKRQLSPLAELERAVRDREFVVHYQPIVDIDSEQCVGAEALVRWCKPDGSMVSPDLFIPLAEESDLILPITDQVIESVMRDLGPLLVADRSLHVAINLAASDVCSGRFLTVLNQHMKRANVLPSQVWLEATERGFMNLDSARSTIEKARALGHMAAVDDFGTGYSSLQYLQQLPLDALKIDKSFVSRITEDETVIPLVSHVIDMARTMNLAMIAEGVETAEQLHYLRQRGVRYAQGWLFAKAMSIKAFNDYYQSRCTESQEMTLGYT